jgi:methylmalonyl-CoA mutase
VFLAELTPLSRRLGFARNLFTTGGFRVVVGEPSDFVDSGAHVVCLCGSDDAYRTEGAGTATALREAGARYIWMAGSPPVEGVDMVITGGSDALAVLRTTAEVCR